MIDLTLFNTVLPYIYVTFIAYEVISTLWRKYSQRREARRIDNIQNIMFSVYASFVQMVLTNEYQPIDDSVRIRLNDLLNKNMSIEFWQILNVAFKGFAKRYFLKSEESAHPVPIYHEYKFNRNVINEGPDFEPVQNYGNDFKLNRPHVINPGHRNLDDIMAQVREVPVNNLGAQPNMDDVCTCGQQCDEKINIQAFFVNVPRNDENDSSDDETPVEKQTETVAKMSDNLAESSSNIPNEPVQNEPVQNEPVQNESILNESIERENTQNDRPRFGARRFGTNVVDHPLKTVNN